MNKSILASLALIIAFTVGSFAQSPNSFNYQSVVRDASGNLLTNQAVGFQFQIQQGSIGGTAVYTETAATTSNDFGLVNFKIGTGITSDDFSIIDWANGPYFLETAVDVSGGTSYMVVGTQQLASVPYALHAKTAESVAVDEIVDADNDTKVQVEETADEDLIRFDIAGIEYFRMSEGRLEVRNTGSSTFIGEFAGSNDPLNDNENTGVGASALENNTSGNMNVAIGANALKANTEGSFNTAAGHNALRVNTTGTRNVAIGPSALRGNTIGIDNVASGFQALYNNESGVGNIALGTNALYLNATGSDNIAIGSSALYYASEGDNNIALGKQVLAANASGDKNIGIGYYSLSNNTSGALNIAMGFRVLENNTTGDENIAIGTNALFNNTVGYKNIAVGQNALDENISGNNNVAVGYLALHDNTEANFNIAVGTQALRKNTTGTSNIAIGYMSQNENLTGLNNVSLGNSSMVLNVSGQGNSAFGDGALHGSTGNYNSAFGMDALHYTTSGGFNTAVGYQALQLNETGIWNTAVGYKAVSSGTAHINAIGIGYNSQPFASNTARIGNSGMTSIGGYANWTNLSDGRFKVNVNEDVSGLEFILKLRPVTYNIDMDALAEFLGTEIKDRQLESEAEKAAQTQTGFIAQEVEAAAKALGYDFSGIDSPKNEQSHYGLRYAEFVVPLVKAVQEQQVIIKKQQKEIEELKILTKKLLEK